MYTSKLHFAFPNARNTLHRVELTAKTADLHQINKTFAGKLMIAFLELIPLFPARVSH